MSFVSPIVSTLLAADCLQPGRTAASVEFTGDAQNYATHIGLVNAMNGAYQPVTARGLAGRTYSPLAHLAQHAEVEAATDLITECLHGQLGAASPALVSDVCRVIGELHDNVASHARGAGYSALQVYRNPDRVEFAVVDAGVGLLRNVQSVEPEMTSHARAIHWCFQKGNTTARPADDWAQRMPEDAISSPYPMAVTTKVTDNHHLGEGLWQLYRLVRQLDGTIWVLTGNAELVAAPQASKASYRPATVAWTGLAIEVSLPIKQHISPGPSLEDDELARRLGI